MFEKKEPKEPVGLRIPTSIRVQAKREAKANGISESEVYRTIITDFFSAKSQHSVDGYVKAMEASK